MGYFDNAYYDSLMHSDEKRDLNGTSVSKEKGTDGKANNTSAYNHEYYMKYKDKWGVKTDSKDAEFDLDAVALDVIRGKYGNGQARKNTLGADYEMIQKRVNEMYKEGKFGNAGTTAAKTETNSNKESNNSTSSTGTKWYNNYNTKIQDTKAQKAEAEARKKVEAESQAAAAKEAEAKAAKKKSKK